MQKFILQSDSQLNLSRLFTKKINSFLCGSLCGFTACMLFMCRNGTTLNPVEGSKETNYYSKYLDRNNFSNFDEKFDINLAQFPPESECLQCKKWQNLTYDKELNMNHEIFLRTHLLEILKGSLTGYSIRSGFVSGTGTMIPFDEKTSYLGNRLNDGFTMIGMPRLNSLQLILEHVLANNVDGDFMECGVWRGGASIFARSLLLFYKSTKKVFVADSFAGLPLNRSNHDTNIWKKKSYAVVSFELVKSNFERFGVFDRKSVIFLKGLFNETMPKAHKEVGRLSVLRIDCDMYESCFDVFSYMYSHVSIGGFVIIDDWNGFPCKEAILALRKELEINENIHSIDGVAVYWQKQNDILYDIELLYKKLF